MYRSHFHKYLPSGYLYVSKIFHVFVSMIIVYLFPIARKFQRTGTVLFIAVCLEPNNKALNKYLLTK